jgi:hypothetical protein
MRLCSSILSARSRPQRHSVVFISSRFVVLNAASLNGLTTTRWGPSGSSVLGPRLNSR